MNLFFLLREPNSTRHNLNENKTESRWWRWSWSLYTAMCFECSRSCSELSTTQRNSSSCNPCCSDRNQKFPIKKRMQSFGHPKIKITVWSAKWRQPWTSTLLYLLSDCCRLLSHIPFTFVGVVNRFHAFHKLRNQFAFPFKRNHKYQKHTSHTQLNSN